MADISIVRSALDDIIDNAYTPRPSRMAQELERIEAQRDGIARICDDALVERDLLIAGLRKVLEQVNDLEHPVTERHLAVGETLVQLHAILERIPGDPSPVRSAIIENAATGETMTIAPGGEMPRGTWRLADAGTIMYSPHPVTVADWHRLIAEWKPAHMTVEDVCRSLIAPDKPFVADRANMAERSVDRIVDALRTIREACEPERREDVNVTCIDESLANVADLIDGTDPVGKILAGLYEPDPHALKPLPTTPEDVALKLTEAVAEQLVKHLPERPMLERILKRLDEARTKWPDADGGFDNAKREGVLTAETLEVVGAARALTAVWTGGEPTDAHDAALRAHLEDELLDVAAVALRWLLADAPFHPVSSITVPILIDGLEVGQAVANAADHPFHSSDDNADDGFPF